MKLSEAIRLGATMKPQGFGMDAYGSHSCALTAACDAVGLETSNAGITELNRRYAWASSVRPMCPACHEHNGHLVTGMCAHLNDDHGWTREQIAGWVETLEQEPEYSARNERLKQYGVAGL